MDGRIMVVDDDPYVLELIQALLASESYEVRAFESAEAALDAARSDPPDAAIVDLAMPGMSGLDLIRAIRSDPRTDHLPVLICSAYYGELIHSASELQDENVARLRKPFDIDEMLRIVDRMVHASLQRPAPSSAGAALRPCGAGSAL